MKDKISVRQICFILVAYNAATKLLLYPTNAASAVGNALIFSALFNLVLQTIIIWSVSFLSSRTDKSFFELLQNTFGTIAARIIYAFFALYFLASAVVPMNEQQLLVHDAFYDTIPSLMVFLPFFIFSVYAGVKSFTNVGRCADMCFPVFIITVACFLIMSVTEGDFTNLLPIMRQPVLKVAGMSLSSLFRFSESAFLLMFMGHYKYKKGDAAKLTISYAAGGVAVIALMASFYALYGPLAPTRSFLLNNISVFFPIVGFVGRVDLFVVYAFDLVVLFAIVLNVQACVHCLCLTFNKNWRIVYSLCANAVLIVITFLVNNNFTVLQKIAGDWMWIPAVLFAYLIPVLAWALRRRSRK
ncbi:MAG: spore germination protein [Clostridia bacterium]|nr:spore germination protein [Clostridia bacterium]